MGNSIVSTALTYDIQNRLRMINNPSLLGTKPFAMELQYNAPNVSGATAQYSGNISAVKWRHNGGGEQSYMVIVPSSALDSMNLGTMGGLVSRAKNSETDNKKIRDYAKEVSCIGIFDSNICK